MNTSRIYVTFYMWYSMTHKNKFAVECLNERQAKDVASDVYSFDGVGNIRFRKCGKPKGRTIIEYNEYYNYKWLSNC